MTWTVDPKGEANWARLSPDDRHAIMHEHPDKSDADVKAGKWSRVVNVREHGAVGDGNTDDAEPIAIAARETLPEIVAAALTEIEGPVGPFWIPSEPPVTRDHVAELSRQVFAGEYDAPEIPAMSRPTILDVGSGWGAFAVWAKAKWPGAQVIGYEPHAAAADLSVKNAPFLELYRVAVTAAPEAFIQVAEYWGSATTFGKTEGVPVAAVHPRDLPPCDVMKLDCEGCEVEVLEGYQHWDVLHVLMCEFHTRANREKVRDMAEDAGLECVKDPEPIGFQSTPEYGVMVFIRKES